MDRGRTRPERQTVRAPLASIMTAPAYSPETWKSGVVTSTQGEGRGLPAAHNTGPTRLGRAVLDGPEWLRCVLRTLSYFIRFHGGLRFIGSDGAGARPRF